MSNADSDDETIPPLVDSDRDQPTQPFTPKSDTSSSPSTADDLPRSFGRYRVVSRLGKGGFGTVYRAVDDHLQRDVAIKVTLGSMIDPSVRQSLLTEARIVASLDHPNIVPVHDVG